MVTGIARPFLRIPPFPGCRAEQLAGTGQSEGDPTRIAEALRTARVGGNFWGARPSLRPDKRDLFVARDANQLTAMIDVAGLSGGTVVAPAHWRIQPGFDRIGPDCDEWWLVDQARAIWCDADADVALIATLCGKEVRPFGSGRYVDLPASLDGAVTDALLKVEYRNPFSGAPTDILSIVGILADWRRLIDTNRGYSAIFGVARWKRVTVDAMLWDGTGPVRYRNSLSNGLGPNDKVVCWKSRMPPQLVSELVDRGVQIVELEDGFIRSIGLGANCVPPLSIILDEQGIYFDPSGPSDLESLLQSADIDEPLRNRASQLGQRLVEASISKYGVGTGTAEHRPAGQPKRILVTGQVEDDRSIVSGGAGQTNLALLQRVRSLEPDAWIIYRPHPDVDAGHRKGHVPDSEAEALASEIRRDGAITDLMASVDEVHVITSLAGFEAIVRDTPVTTHGLPFYAGWGLTRDVSNCSERRQRSRSRDELLACALILYPRYLDPVSRLPCAPEILIKRLRNGDASVRTPLVALREWQGRLRVVMRSLFGQG